MYCFCIQSKRNKRQSGQATENKKMLKCGAEVSAVVCWYREETFVRHWSILAGSEARTGKTRILTSQKSTYPQLGLCPVPGAILGLVSVTAFILYSQVFFLFLSVFSLGDYVYE